MKRINQQFAYCLLPLYIENLDYELFMEDKTMNDKTKAIGTVAAGAATGGVIAGLPGIIIGIVVAAAGAAIANKASGEK